MGNCVPDLRRFQVVWTPTKVWVQPQPPGPQVKVRLLVGLRERKRVLPSCELWLLSGRTTPAPRGASQQPVWAGGAIASPPSPLEESETSGRWNGFAQDASVCYWLVDSVASHLPLGPSCCLGALQLSRAGLYLQATGLFRQKTQTLAGGGRKRTSCFFVTCDVLAVTRKGLWRHPVSSDVQLCLSECHLQTKSVRVCGPHLVERT